MAETDCISNRNTKIIATYLMSRLGHYDELFNNLDFPSNQYKTPEDFFLNEDEWTSFENFEKVFRRAKEMSGEPYFFFNCGASSANLRSWGKYHYFARVLASPDEGFKRVSFFNKNFNTTKEIEIVVPPSYERESGKMKVVFKVQYHKDLYAQRDYISDPYRRGLISSIPTLWGLSPALIKQKLNQYDPVTLLNEEPEFACFSLEAKMENGYLSINLPSAGGRKIVGRIIRMNADMIDGQPFYLGKYDILKDISTDFSRDNGVAVLITETVKSNNRVLLKSGEIYNAPYFILEVKYDRISFKDRLSTASRIRRNVKESGEELIDTINKLRETIKSRNRAYHELEKINLELRQAKQKLEEYNINLERIVQDRTSELIKAKDDLIKFNKDLEEKVRLQVEELKSYNDLRRYLSPKLTEKILSSGGNLGNEPKRKMLTVVFTDIRGFSTFTDRLEPEELFYLLDGYLSEMTKIIHEYDGTLNKIIGDGLLIFFNDPVPLEDHALRAVRMAIRMQNKVKELNLEWIQYGYNLGIGIGINTGYMTVGNIGSSSHMDYTVIGNQVNVASRLESMAKSGEILISQRTYSKVQDFVSVIKEEKISVKGIHSPVTTYYIRAE